MPDFHGSGGFACRDAGEGLPRRNLLHADAVQPLRQGKQAVQHAGKGKVAAQLLLVQPEMFFCPEIGVICHVPGIQAGVFLTRKAGLQAAERFHFTKKGSLDLVQQLIDELYGVFPVFRHALAQGVIRVFLISA